MLGKPIVVHVTLLFGHTADDDRPLRSAERVVVNREGRTRDVRAVFAIAPAVHVEAVAQRHAQLHVMARHVSATGSAGTRQGMAIPVKQVVLDQGRRNIVAHAIAESVVLAVMKEVVMDVMPRALVQRYACQARRTADDGPDSVWGSDRGCADP